MKVYIESKDDIVEAKTDSRGRLTLGSEFSNENVTVGILEREGDEESKSSDDETAAAIANLNMLEDVLTSSHDDAMAESTALSLVRETRDSLKSQKAEKSNQ